MEIDICRSADHSFGPAVPSRCRGGFDFTFLFEDVFFSLLPAIALLLASSFRLWRFRSVGGGVKSLLGVIKLVSRAGRVYSYLSSRKRHANLESDAVCSNNVCHLSTGYPRPLEHQTQDTVSPVNSCIDIQPCRVACNMPSITRRGTNIFKAINRPQCLSPWLDPS